MVVLGTSKGGLVRTALSVIVPWIVWGIVENLVYWTLFAVFQESFDKQLSMPRKTATVVLVLFPVLRASNSIACGWIAAKIAKGFSSPIPYVAGSLLLTGLAVHALSWGFDSSYSVWFHVGFLAPILPCALLGAKLGQVRTSD